MSATHPGARFAVLAALAVSGAAPAYLTVGRDLGDLMLIGAAVTLGAWLVLRVDSHRGLPLAYAVVLVLIAGFSTETAALAIVVALVVAEILGVGAVRDRAVRGAERIVACGAALVAYQAVLRAVDVESLGAQVVALCTGIVAVIAVDETVRMLHRDKTGFGERGRLAWLALASSGILMALGYRGVDGKGDFGVWGALLFAVPLLATWFAFERFHSASRTHTQTIDALSMAPELGGLVRSGHAERVAEVADGVAALLDVSDEDRASLHTAAKLHHLGVVTLDDPSGPGEAHDPALVAQVTSSMLGEIGHLERVARIVSSEPLPNRPPGGGPAPTRAARILKVASIYDELTEGDDTKAAAALEALFGAPTYVYDPSVLVALERYLESRGVLVPAA